MRPAPLRARKCPPSSVTQRSHARHAKHCRRGDGGVLSASSGRLIGAHHRGGADRASRHDRHAKARRAGLPDTTRARLPEHARLEAVTRLPCLVLMGPSAGGFCVGKRDYQRRQTVRQAQPREPQTRRRAHAAASRGLAVLAARWSTEAGPGGAACASSTNSIGIDTSIVTAIMSLHMGLSVIGSKPHTVTDTLTTKSGQRPKVCGKTTDRIFVGCALCSAAAYWHGCRRRAWRRRCLIVSDDTG
jgi:hypothetical protein